jgi:hypothetical protein
MLLDWENQELLLPSSSSARAGTLHFMTANQPALYPTYQIFLVLPLI